MTFWVLGAVDTPALIEPAYNNAMSYKQLKQEVDSFSERLTTSFPDKQLGIVFVRNTMPSVVAYLAALAKRDAVLLLDSKLSDETKQSFIRMYRPGWIFDRELTICADHQTIPLHPELALLLTTSGSTGNPKLVRISYESLQANASSIADYLRLTTAARPITTMSMAYSYGLSVVNSHLSRGASILLTDESVMSKNFWNIFNDFAATSFAGVPYFYQMLHRLKFHRMELPTLRSFTQAGGRLSESLISYFLHSAEERDAEFFIMYGQTEATARMSYVPSHRLADKIGSIGIPIPGGNLAIDQETSELIYTGPNVMMGYAEKREDLAQGDMLQGRLNTGDLARIDADGYFWIEGRMKRIIKLYGLRMNLDDLEQFISKEVSCNAACIGRDEQLLIVIEGRGNEELKDQIRNSLKKRNGIHHTSIRCVFIESLPRLENGKLNYMKLKEVVDA